MDKCYNDDDPFTQSPLEEPIVRFQVSPSKEKFNCYGKEKLKMFIASQVEEGINAEDVKDPLSNVKFGLDFINENYPEYGHSRPDRPRPERPDVIDYDYLRDKMIGMRAAIVQRVPNPTDYINDVAEDVSNSNLSYNDYEELLELAVEANYDYDNEIFDEIQSEPVINKLREKMAALQPAPQPAAAPRRSFVQALRRFMGLGGKRTRKNKSRRKVAKKSRRKVAKKSRRKVAKKSRRKGSKKTRRNGPKKHRK